MDIQASSVAQHLHSKGSGVSTMTRLKDTTEPSDDNSWGWINTFHRHSDKAIKVCIILLAAMFGALIVVIIFMAHPPMKLNILSENDSALVVQARILDKVEHEFEIGTCQWKNCTLGCRNTKNIYLDVYFNLHTSTCEFNITLNIYSQAFQNHMLANNWKPSNKDIKEVSIAKGNFIHIMNEAFNSVDFTNTEVVRLIEIDVHILSNGVLLGLSKLTWLYIVGKVREVHRCFFQPVQTSLTRLTLNVGMVISGDENIFGISYMLNLASLDLSDNTINGPLTRGFFAAVPNIKCLTLSNSKIASIDEDAFADIFHNLQLLDLSNNQLASIDVGSFEQIIALGKVNIYLLGNDWYCNCALKPLVNLYHSYEDSFKDMPYCKGPLLLYGVLFVNVDFEIDCLNTSESSVVTTPNYDIKSESNLPVATTTTSSTQKSTTELATSEGAHIPSPFQMRCLSTLSVSSEDDSSSSDQMEYFLFEPPCHEFEVILLKNNSAQVVVEDSDEPINIVWFSDAIENFVYTIEGITIDYNCEGYTKPFLIIDNLLEKSAYTFCLVPIGTYAITPFNCLPLYVPARINDEDVIWISSDDRQFTVGIVCLIFTCSILFGGVIAYFGIKAYPDLLEGSRHVLVVKKSDKTCYVSTITDYMADPDQLKNSFNKKSISKKTPLSCSHSVPPISSPPPLPPTKEKEECRDESIKEPEDHYELPCIYNNTHECQLQCIPNKYAMSPMSPPPLPKRNSDIVFSGTELLNERYYPKMSF